MHQHFSVAEQVHIYISVIITIAYLTVPFTALRRIPLPRITQISGILFFLTCAITHVGLAAGLHESNWFILNDAIQMASVIIFIVTLIRMVDRCFDQAKEREAALKADSARASTASD